MGKNVSIKPSDAISGPVNLNTSDKREMQRIGELSIDEVSVSFLAPPNDDGYFNFRTPPSDWVMAAELFPEPHLFLHTFCLMSSDKSLRQYCDARDKLLALARDSATEPPVRSMLTAWLSHRPDFSPDRMQKGRTTRVQWNGWSKEIVRAFYKISRKDYGLTATRLWLVFSSKSMLTSEKGVGQLDDLRKNLVEKWDSWLAEEVQDFGSILASLTH